VFNANGFRLRVKVMVFNATRFRLRVKVKVFNATRFRLRLWCLMPLYLGSNKTIIEFLNFSYEISSTF